MKTAGLVPAGNPEKSPLVEIVLSTYNGAHYLSQLFDSILAQTYTHWRMLIRDDGSSDSTLKIIAAYVAAHPGRFELIRDGLGNLGPSASFNKLLETARADYLAICDQDDLWTRDKLACQVNAMMAAEGSYGKNKPLLVHSDLAVFGSGMEPIAGSFWKYQRIDPEKMKDIRCLLVQNFVTGCTLLINRALCRSSLPIPREAAMFDWWIALVAFQAGKIVTLPVSLVKYRQHGSNAVGAKKWGVRYFIARATQPGLGFRAELKNTQLQAGALWHHLKRIDAGPPWVIKEYGVLHQKTWWSRKRAYMAMGVRKYGWLRQIVTWLVI